MNKYCFITGMLRSGTTLLDKLLCNHHDISMLSQPFPLLFTDAKMQFYKYLGLDRGHYVLSHMFAEDRYDINCFNDYLDNTLRYAGPELSEIFFKMKEYSGQLHRVDNVNQLIRAMPASTFSQTVYHLLRILRHREQPSVLGSKETLMDEFIPYLIRHECRCVSVIRDPRDVMASLISGDGPQFGGKIRPMLYHLRNWRKSVAYALDQQNDMSHIVIRYEDLVRNAEATLSKICQFLDLESYGAEAFKDGIRDQRGNLWKGNSSHGAKLLISQESMGSYRSVLSSPSVNYIEYVCRPEMMALGYEFDSHSPISERALYDFKEPVGVERKDIPADYSVHPERLGEEVSRIECLHDSTEVLDHRSSRLFLSTRVFKALQHAVACR